MRLSACLTGVEKMRIALIQQAIVPGDKQANYDRVEALVSEAVTRSDAFPDIVVLPETAVGSTPPWQYLNSKRQKRVTRWAFSLAMMAIPPTVLAATTDAGFFLSLTHWEISSSESP